MSVIDAPLRFSQCPPVLSHDEILAELRRAVEQRRFSQKWLAEELGIAPARVSEMLKGTRRVQPAEMAPLAALLGMTSENTLAVEGLMPVPLIGDVPGGNWREAVKRSVASVPIPDPSVPPNAFALRVKGDSMDLVVEEGGVIVVDPDDKELFAGKYYVVMNGEGETTFKQFRRDPPRLSPCSTNPTHEEIPISEPFMIVGRIVWKAGRM